MAFKPSEDNGQSQAEWTVLLLAGQRPGVDPLASHFDREWKALVPIAGRAMLSHVAENLLQSALVRRIIILSQAPDALKHALPDDPRIAYHTSLSGISNSIWDAIESGAAEFPILVTTADNPLLDSAMLDQFLHAAQTDLAIGMVEKRVYDAQYAGEPRTWLKFRGEAWSGANLFALRSAKVKAPLQLWAQAEKDRKTPWKLFRHFGLWLLLRALTRSIRLGDALEKAGRRLGLSARLVAMDDPAAAIDVDKPADHHLAEKIIAKREAAKPCVTK